MRKEAYTKDFDTWHRLKKETDAIALSKVPYFNEREIWWCRLGCNIGYEQDGKSRNFLRPVLILRKYNAHLCMALPLTSKIKTLPFYFAIGKIAGNPTMAIVSQLRPLSSKRLTNKILTLSEEVFVATKKAASEYIFGS